MFVYSEATATLVNAFGLLLVAVFVLATPPRRGAAGGSSSISANFGAFAAATARAVGVLLGCVLGPVLVAALVTVTGRSMQWYSYPALALALYAFAGLTGGLFAQELMVNAAKACGCGGGGGGDNDDRVFKDKVITEGSPSSASPSSLSSPSSSSLSSSSSCSSSDAELEAFRGAIGLWSIFLALMTWRNISSAYAAMVWVLCAVAVRLALLALNGGGGSGGGRPGRLTSVGATVSYILLGVGPPATLWLQYMFTLYEFFVPLMGRIGTEVPPDVIVSVLIGLVTGLLALVPLSLLLLDRRK